MTDAVTALLVVFAIMAALVVILFVSTGLLAVRHRRQRSELTKRLGEVLGMVRAEDRPAVRERQAMLGAWLRVQTQNLTTGDLVMDSDLADHIRDITRGNG
jgi:hypothetical protein